MTTRDFLETLEDDFYGLWEVQDMLAPARSHDLQISLLLRLANERKIMVLRATAGNRSHMTQIFGSEMVSALSNPHEWLVPETDDELALFICSKTGRSVTSDELVL
jgi:hypothetical protein